MRFRLFHTGATICHIVCPLAQLHLHQVSYDLRSYEKVFQASIRNCLNRVHNCEDHSLLDFKSAVQYMKHFIHHFTTSFTTVKLRFSL